MGEVLLMKSGEEKTASSPAAAPAVLKIGL